MLVATGSEVSTALAARDLLADQGVGVRVVSMPSWELFEAQPADYRDEVLPADVPKISVEAGTSFGWSRWVDRVGLDRHVRRIGARRRGARALRDQPRGGRAAGQRDDRRAGKHLGRVQVRVGFTPGEQVAAPVGIVIDVLRATSTICQALAGGYERVVCVGEVDDARALAGAGVALAGERDNVRIDGFDFGNSPREFAGGGGARRRSS